MSSKGQQKSPGVAEQILGFTGKSKDERKLAFQLYDRAADIEPQQRSAVLDAITKKVGELKAVAGKTAKAIINHLTNLWNILVGLVGTNVTQTTPLKTA